MNYAALSAAVTGWMHRNDASIVANADLFIDMAEGELSRLIKHPAMEALTTLNTSTAWVALPSDFIGPKSARIGTNQLKLQGYDTLQSNANANTLTGATQYYAVAQNKLYLFPGPTTSTDISLVYYQRLPALSLSNANNWLGDAYPDAYLYATLKHAAVFMKRVEDAQGYQALMSGAVDEINKQAAWFSYGAAPLSIPKTY